MSLNVQPLTASVTITVSGTNWYNSTTNAALPANQFRLIGGLINLSAAGRASQAQLTIEDNAATLFSTFTVGSSVAINIGKVFAGGWTSVFVGNIERADEYRLSFSTAQLNLYCTDLMQVLMNKVVIHYVKKQKRNPDSTLVASDAISVRATDIIVDLMNSATSGIYFNGVNSGISAALTTSTPAGFIVPNNNLSIPDVNFVFKPLHDCLKELFDYLRYDWGVDASGRLYGRPIEAAPNSNVTISTDLLQDLRVEDSILDMKNVIFVIGADQMIASTGVTTNLSSFMDNSSLFLAQKFTVKSDNVGEVQIMLDKVGSPGNAAVAVYTDNNNTPSQTAIVYSDINKDVVVAGSPALVQFEISHQLTTQQPYWIALHPQKSATAYYRWWTDGSATQTTATATDSLALQAAGGWSTRASTSAFGHNIWYVTPVQKPAIELKSTSTYGVRELADRQPEVKNYAMAAQWGEALKQTMARKKQLLTINSVPPNTILTPGQLINVADVSIIATTFIMTDVIYELRGMESFNMQIKAMRYVQA